MTSSVRAYAMDEGSDIIFGQIVDGVSSAAYWVYKVAKALIFGTCGLIYNTCAGIGGWINYKITRILLPASSEQEEINQADENAACKRSQYTFGFLEHRGADDAILRGFEMKNGKTTRWIFYFPPFEKSAKSCLRELKDLAVTTECNLMCYDYRGVGRSDGDPYDEEQIVQDAVSILSKYKRDRDFVLYGKELAGGLAAVVAKKLDTRGQVVHLACVDTALNLERFRTDASWYGSMTNWVFARAGWKLDVEEAVTHLRSRSKFLVITHPSSPTCSQVEQLMKKAPRGRNSVVIKEGLNLFQEQKQISQHIKNIF